MTEQRIAVVIGATGTVGSGIVRQLGGAGWQVIAIARDAAKLDALKSCMRDVQTLSGSVASDAQAIELAARVRAAAPRIDAVVTSINTPPAQMRLLDIRAGQLAEVIDGNLVSHHIAARAFIPLLAAHGRYVGIGGGMADFTVAGVGPTSMCQAALRNMFRFFALETEEQNVSVVELMLFSHIVDPADDATANPREIRADEVGEHLRAVLERPDEFIGPILALKSRRQIGQPERQQSRDVA